MAYDPNQPRAPEGTAIGGQWIAAGFQPLSAGAPPWPALRRDIVQSMHKKWTPEQVEDYCKRCEAISAEAGLEKKIRLDGGENFKDKARASLDRIRQVHEPVTGVRFRQTAQSDLDALTGGGVGGTKGCYQNRDVFLPPSFNHNTFCHEYGHYIDNMLGVTHGGQQTKPGFSTISEAPALQRHFTRPLDKTTAWERHEAFAEVYSAWVRSGANVERTMNRLAEEGTRWPRGFVDDLDALLRSELRMRK